MSQWGSKKARLVLAALLRDRLGGQRGRLLDHLTPTGIAHADLMS